MPSGLYINLNDGGPVMEITAGLRCPAFANQLSTQWDNNTYDINGYVPGSQIVVFPKDCVFRTFRGTNLVPTIGMFSGYSQNGSQITMDTWWSDNWGRARTFDSAIWQIYPSSISGNSGLFIQDSSNFLAITNTSSIGYCIYRGTIVVNGSWTMPTFEGIDRSRYICFARWSADGITVEFDGNNITACRDKNGDDESASVTMQIAVFAAAQPNPSTGLNFFNASGQCTFSTSKRPFVYTGFNYNPSWGYQDIGNRFVMLGRYGYDSTVSGSQDYLKWAGLMMSGNYVRCAKGRTNATWTSRYSVTGSRLTSLNIPCIENMY
ncbi:DUF6453 family protein [Raoultella ornithinolytica]|uniref:DUF6453 family protein n=1 Tax=Raoultella ornithinolytica TaxID=54291 RepID=A0A9Q9JCF0_RAOOR|nr:DUF6453 family protein [Raoultella ornithinolytica]UXE36435.1 DUF6453 family protein [Raoultella ornithinolytica]